MIDYRDIFIQRKPVQPLESLVDFETVKTCGAQICIDPIPIFGQTVLLISIGRMIGIKGDQNGVELELNEALSPLVEPGEQEVRLRKEPPSLEEINASGGSVATLVNDQ